MLPEAVEPKDLHPAARNELKTLQADVQERVARHLAMVAFLIDDDPELAHQHALSASRRAGRIPVARETLAITAYRTGDFALALREIRTYRRLSGLEGHVAIMVDSERGLGRPEKAIETGLAADTSKLDTEQRVHLAIAMSGARLDLGQTQQALFELEIPELNPSKAFSWSPDLFSAYSAVLEDLGRADEAATWLEHANRAARALQAHHGSQDELEVFEVYEEEPIDLDAPDESDSELRGDDNSEVAADNDDRADARESADQAGAPGEDADREELTSTSAPAIEEEASEHADPERADDDEAAGERSSAGDQEIVESDETGVGAATSEEQSLEEEVNELLAAAGILDDDAAENAGAPGPNAAGASEDTKGDDREQQR